MSRRYLVPSLVVAASLVAVACSGSAGSSVVPSAAVADPSAAASTELVADIDVGGRTLHLVCLGPTDTGEPTVVFEAGLEAPYNAWGEILLGMQATHRVCAYDRAGLGMSDPTPDRARTTTDLVDDLKTMLDTAGVEGPYLLASHSVGAWPATLFAQRYPDAVAGLVFVDPRGPSVSTAWRDALPPAASDEPDAIAANRDELTTFEMDALLNRSHLDLTAGAAEVAEALDASGPLFGDRPVVVLSAAGTTQSWSDLPADLAASFDAAWAAGQQGFADESTEGSLIVVPDTGHDIPNEQPPAVIDAIESMLAELAGR